MTTTDPGGRTRIWFIRHGESEANRNLHLVSGRSNHTPLSPAGREQAQALGVALLDCDYLPDAIYTSPALRTVTTADLALRAMGITDSAQPDGRLQELDQGEWTGLPRDQVYSVANQAAIAAAGVDFKPPGGESTAAATAPSRTSHMSSTSLAGLLAVACGPLDVVQGEQPVRARAEPEMRRAAAPADGVMSGESPVTDCQRNRSVERPSPQTARVRAYPSPRTHLGFMSSAGDWPHSPCPLTLTPEPASERDAGTTPRSKPER